MLFVVAAAVFVAAAVMQRSLVAAGLAVLSVAHVWQPNV